ncbi:50S ribosomal protein L25 [bacterium]|jgi:large subunit ribosomal protein L25|nr:50S ribosomal protein L25 [bacterium]MBT4251157.1 50S ribosomal protein L25 [bacterium]MBT4598051.1 50S ribosomal protein L25 [bacterium]MBT6753394.1 50S ribosomal protein L25 [bacterium]MBT7038107.1 50S ribosomal protein L25 [bacterium]
MEEITLKARIRKEGEKLTKETREIPAVVYGKKIGSIAIFVNLSELNRIFDKAGESTIINLQVEDEKGKNEIYKTLIYDYQTEAIGNEFIHVDFFNVKMDQKIETNVELEFVGESIAVKELGGTFVRGLDSVEVQCLPADLPGSIEIDISVLDSFDKHIYVKDVIVGEKISILTDDTIVVAAVSAPRTKEDVESLDEAVDSDISQVEGMEEIEAEGAAEGDDEKKKEKESNENKEKKEKKE